MSKISIIMPVYNGINYLDDAIQSILNQTEKDFEFIIIDDGSTEPIFQKIQSYKDDRIIAIRQDENKGLAFRLNDCLDLATGDFIVRMDSDDISHPRRIEKQLQLFTEGVGFVGCWGRSIDINGNPINHYVDIHCRCTDKDLEDIYPIKHCMIDASVIFTREVFNRIGYFDTSVFNGESYNYNRRIQRYFKGRICQEILYIRRVGSGVAKRNNLVDIFKLSNMRARKFSVIKVR